jgi:2-C-methyl-D-erythritol 4-phosphate cytidylyltransferase / 2-C-methyl-D-erythritol 2,4-cyclodiphosphate synthase
VQSLSQHHIALVPAAGSGQRFGAAQPKQYSLLAGAPMLWHTVSALLAFEPFSMVLVVVSPDDTMAAQVLADLITPHSPKQTTLQKGQTQSLPPSLPLRLRIAYVGGDSRASTVRKGLQALSQLGVADTTTVWVHDAARPAISQALLRDLAQALHAAPAGALLATPVADTLKRSISHNTAHNTVDTTQSRDGLWQAQTPQCFPLAALKSALDAAQAQGLVVTDEASAMEAAGFNPAMVLGSSHNFKVTQPQDAALMEAVLMMNIPQTPTTPTIQTTRLTESKQSAQGAGHSEPMQHAAAQLSIGEGMDVHALVAGRPLILGGVTIPHHLGLLGHSDADALLHAVTDALLGAAGMGDIGRLFPDTDAVYAGADSQVLLKHAYAKVAAAGWRVVNVDATIVAQAPKMAAHIPAMQANIAACLAVLPQRVNVKAKTNERLGWLGRQEGIEVRAVLLLQRV